MKFRYTYPKKLFSLFLLVALMLAFTGCDWFKELFNKDEPAKVENISDSGSLNIGPEGGTVILNNLEIKIPAGAFTTETNITINELTGDAGLGEYANSNLYQVAGLPENFNKPIKVKIKYNEANSGDPLVAVGSEKYATSLDSMFFAYHTVEAVDSSGYLIYEIDPSTGNNKSAFIQNDALADGIINLIALSKYIRVTSSNGHFNLSYPVDLSNEGQQMGNHFETAYTLCKSMDLSYDARTKWGVDVFAMPMKKNIGGYYSSRYYKNMTDEQLRKLINDGDFTINTEIFSDDLELRTTCGHEFMHMVQNLYEFSSSLAPDQIWLMEATSCWMEEKISNVNYHVPSTLTNRETYLFKGWQYENPEALKNTISAKHAEQGYGMTPLIKDLVEVNGKGVIKQIFEYIKSAKLPDNPVDPVDAVLSVLNEPVGNFWHGILGSYVLGHYYNNKVNFNFLDNIMTYNNMDFNWNLFTFNELMLSEKLNLKLMDLSGNLFKLQFDDAFKSYESVPVRIKVSDPVNCGLLISKYKKGIEISVIEESFPGESGEFIVEVQPLINDGYELFVVTSNATADKSKNYQGVNEIELTAEILPANYELFVSFGLHNADFVVSYDNGDPSKYKYGEDHDLIFNYPVLQDETNPNLYVGNIDITEYSTHYSGIVQIELIEEPRKCANYFIDLRSTFSGSYPSRHILKCDSIPYALTYEDDVIHNGIVDQYSLGMPFSKASVADGNVDYSYNGSGIGSTITLTGFTNNSQDWLNVSFIRVK